MIGRTDLSLDSVFLCAEGTECLRDAVGGEVETGGDVERGGVSVPVGDSEAGHSAESGVYVVPFVPGSQDVILLAEKGGNEDAESRSGVVLVGGLALEGVVWFIIDKGASMLNI